MEKTPLSEMCIRVPFLQDDRTENVGSRVEQTPPVRREGAVSAASNASILPLPYRECQAHNSEILASNADITKRGPGKSRTPVEIMAIYNVLPASQRLDSIIGLDVSAARAMTPLRPMHVRDYRPSRKLQREGNQNECGREKGLDSRFHFPREPHAATAMAFTRATFSSHSPGAQRAGNILDDDWTPPRSTEKPHASDSAASSPLKNPPVEHPTAPAETPKTTTKNAGSTAYADASEHPVRDHSAADAGKGGDD